MKPYSRGMNSEAGPCGSDLALPLVSCVTLDKLVNLSEPQSPSLEMAMVPTSHEYYED